MSIALFRPSGSANHDDDDPFELQVRSERRILMLSPSWFAQTETDVRPFPLSIACTACLPVATVMLDAAADIVLPTLLCTRSQAPVVDAGASLIDLIARAWRLPEADGHAGLISLSTAVIKTAITEDLPIGASTRLWKALLDRALAVVHIAAEKPETNGMQTDGPQQTSTRLFAALEALRALATGAGGSMCGEARAFTANALSTQVVELAQLAVGEDDGDEPWTTQRVRCRGLQMAIQASARAHRCSRMSSCSSPLTIETQDASPHTSSSVTPRAPPSKPT
jgi:hypothetical protein